MGVAIRGATVRRTALRGIAMLELLITLMLVAFTVAGVVSLQSKALRMQRDSDNRLLAVTLVRAITERMEANLPGARSGFYALSATSTETGTTAPCTERFCTPAEIATFDLGQWSAQVATALPIKTMRITRNADVDGLVNYDLSLEWYERRGSQKYTSDADLEVAAFVTTKYLREPAP